ncbi:MAG: protease-like activity factor CPAF [Elusimicrobia bacterium]|nr:protease-like activity factor CPAF [Elusimicrobiota bacterium]
MKNSNIWIPIPVTIFSLGAVALTLIFPGQAHAWIEQQEGVLRQFFDQSPFAPNALNAAIPIYAENSKKESQDVLKRRMLQNLEFIESSFRAQYAPAPWKEKYAGWDLTREVQTAKKEISQSKDLSMKQYHGILQRLIQSAQDYHVSIRFTYTEASSLPFAVMAANERYFIAWVDRNKLPESVSPFNPGDELIEFGGRSSAQAVKEIQKTLGNNTATTDHALAALFLTARAAVSGLEIEKGPLVITVKPKNSEKNLTRQLIWEHQPELVNQEPQKPQTGNLHENKDKKWILGMADMLSPVEDLSGLQEVNPSGLRHREGYLPPLGVKIWQSGPEEPFHAYIFRSTQNRLIGYVRIPSYAPQDASQAVEHFGKLMAKFQTTTDALVIDQLNNPGGSLFYIYALASMLTDQSLVTPKHRVALTQQDAFNAASILQLEKEIKNDEDAKRVLGKNISGYPVTYQYFRHLLEYARFIINEWDNGRTLSDPTHLEGVDRINPSEAARYTKPIVLLINELDFSGGDFFPAILQDNKRAILLGSRTAGAGGFVRRTQYSNQLGIQVFSITGSLAQRVDNNPIENIGVRPDIVYPLTVDDLQNQFRGYIRAVNEALEKLTPI